MANPTLNSNVTQPIALTSQYIQQVWTREVQQPFDIALQAAKLVTDRSGLVSGGGNVINVPFASIVAARAKAASTAIVFDSPEGAPVTININKHYYVGVLIEDLASVQSNYDLRSVFQQRMASALATQVDTDLMSQYTNAGTTVTGGANITDANILAVVTAFDAANVPFSDRNGIVGHNTKADLLGINKYVAYDQTGTKGVAVDGSQDLGIGEVYGISLYHSGNVQLSTTGRNLFFHKSALSLAQQMAPKFVMQYSVDYLGMKTALETVYGVGVERASALIQLTRPTAA